MLTSDQVILCWCVKTCYSWCTCCHILPVFARIPHLEQVCEVNTEAWLSQVCVVASKTYLFTSLVTTDSFMWLFDLLYRSPVRTWQLQTSKYIVHTLRVIHVNGKKTPPNNKVSHYNRVQISKEFFFFLSRVKTCWQFPSSLPWDDIITLQVR